MLTVDELTALDDLAKSLATDEWLGRQAKRKKPAKSFFLPTVAGNLTYVYLSNQYGHPLADSEGCVYLHRRVIWDRLGPGVHSCDWCTRLITWSPTEEQKANKIGRLVGDHIDGNTLNNDPSNIAASCFSCNIKRGRQGR